MLWTAHTLHRVKFLTTPANTRHEIPNPTNRERSKQCAENLSGYCLLAQRLTRQAVGDASVVWLANKQFVVRMAAHIMCFQTHPTAAFVAGSEESIGGKLSPNQWTGKNVDVGRYEAG